MELQVYKSQLSEVGNNDKLIEDVQKKSSRLESLDALRGFDMLCIVGGDRLAHVAAETFDNSLLNTISEHMHHVQWEGFRFYDLIFPLFLFIAGVAIPFSLKAQQKRGKSNKQIFFYATVRLVLLVLLGIVYNEGLNFSGMEHTRFASVLGLIGIGYYFAFLIVMNFSVRVQSIACAAIIIGYWVLMNWYPVPEHGSGKLTADGSFTTYIDRLWLPGKLHYGKYDPEGIMQSVSSISVALIGAITGSWLLNQSFSKWSKLIGIFVAGLVLICVGSIWGNFYPIIKRLWTGSYVILASGWSLVLLSAFYLAIDCIGLKKWAFFFKVIGLNSITIYLGAKIIDFGYTSNFLFGGMIKMSPDQYHRFGGVIGLLIVEWFFLYYLYKNKIFLKI